MQCSICLEPPQENIEMPVYEYKCLECGAITEILRPIKSREEGANCGRCGAITERIISRFNTVRPITSQGSSETLNVDATSKPRVTGVRLRGGSAKFKDCRFQNLETGISVSKGSKLNIDGSKFDNVDSPIKVIDE